MKPDPKNIKWMSAHEFVENHTKKIAREFKTSFPRPRNKEMGFKAEKKIKNPWK